MAVCPNCGNNVVSPIRKLENAAFCISFYICPECRTKFKTGC